MRIHTNSRAIFWLAEYQVIAVSTKEYFWKGLSATQLSVTISELSSALCFTGINIAEGGCYWNETFQASILEAGRVLAEFGPQALSTFQESTSSSITLAGMEAVLFQLVKPRLVTDQVLL